METIKIWNDNPSQGQISEICETLEQGGTIIMPTDTLYGIACDALNPKAIDKICRMKGINPEKSHLSIICSDISMAAEYARFGNADFHLLKELTPGPYTFLFRSASTLPKAFKGRKTVGVRIPDCTLCREITSRLGHPVMTTSVDFQDEDHAVSPGLIAETYEGRVDLFVEGEDGAIEPSTIIDCTESEPVVVREGKGPVTF